MIAHSCVNTSVESVQMSPLQMNSLVHVSDYGTDLKYLVGARSQVVSHPLVCTNTAT